MSINGAKADATILVSVILLLVEFTLGPAFADERYGPFVVRDASPYAIRLEGEIDPSASEDFMQAVRRHNPSAILLDSPGGSLGAGLEIARYVHDLGLETFIPPGAMCASACSLIYFAGNPRTIAGTLGVHQFSSTLNTVGLVRDTERDTQEVVAEIWNELQRFGTPASVMVRMLSTPPNRMYWFTRSEIENEGLETRFDENGPQTPSGSGDHTERSDQRRVAGGPEDQHPPRQRHFVSGLSPDGDGFLALREGPSTDWPILERMPNGTRLEVVETSGQWKRVKTMAGRVGWAHSNWIACCLSIEDRPETTLESLCDHLWHERNSIWHSYGYCFQTERGVRAFGNSGCTRTLEATIQAMIDSDRQRVENIRNEEIRLQCD